MMLGAFAETSAAAVPQRSCQFLPCDQCAGIMFSARQKIHGIQNWVGEGSYKTRIWFNQNGRSGGFNFCHELFGLGVFFVAYHSVRAFLRQFELATRRELPVLPERRSRHFYFFTVDGSKLLLSGESV
jgi:hypothetical protein